MLVPVPDLHCPVLLPSTLALLHLVCTRLYLGTATQAATAKVSTDEKSVHYEWATRPAIEGACFTHPTARGLAAHPHKTQTTSLVSQPVTASTQLPAVQLPPTSTSSWFRPEDHPLPLPSRRLRPRELTPQSTSNPWGASLRVSKSRRYVTLFYPKPRGDAAWMRCALLPLSIHWIEGWAYLYYLAGSIVVPATSTTSRSGNLVPFALPVTYSLAPVLGLWRTISWPFGLFACPARLRLPCLVPSIALGYTRPRPIYRAAPKCASLRRFPFGLAAHHPLNLPRHLPYILPTTANEQTHICPNRIYPPLRQSRSVPRLNPLSPNNVQALL